VGSKAFTNANLYRLSFDRIQEAPSPIKPYKSAKPELLPSFFDEDFPDPPSYSSTDTTSSSSVAPTPFPIPSVPSNLLPRPESTAPSPSHKTATGSSLPVDGIATRSSSTSNCTLPFVLVLLATLCCYSYIK
jgi:hypothetical protein